MAELVREVSVVMDARAIQEYFNSPAGPLLRYEIQLADRVETYAKQQVGYDEEKPPGEQGGAHLRDTIVKRIVQGFGGPEVHVGTQHPIALIHHDGTAAHEIVPVRAKVLSWVVGGIRVFARRVMHPGTRPNRFLTDSLDRVMTEEGGASGRAA